MEQMSLKKKKNPTEEENKSLILNPIIYQFETKPVCFKLIELEKIKASKHLNSKYFNFEPV